MAEQTTEDIRRTLAEFMGYSEIREIENREVEAFPLIELWGYNPQKPGTMDVPDYTHDLNACHEVEAELANRGWAAKYLHELYDALPDTSRLSEEIDPDLAWERWEWFVAHATAEQRARAAYHVIKEYFNG